MNKLVSAFMYSVLAGILYAGACPQPAQAFNLLTDIQNNVAWKFGSAAQVGEGYNFTQKAWDTSALAEIAEYRFLSFSYGATYLNQNSASGTDTFKIGLLSNFFFAWFHNQPPSSMLWMENLNVGPSFAIPVFSQNTGHKGTLLLDLNYKFGS